MRVNSMNKISTKMILILSKIVARNGREQVTIRSILENHIRRNNNKSTILMQILILILRIRKQKGMYPLIRITTTWSLMMINDLFFLYYLNKNPSKINLQQFGRYV